MRKWSIILAVIVIVLFPLIAFAQDPPTQEPNTGGSPLSSTEESHELGIMLAISTLYGLLVRPILDWAINKSTFPNEISGAVMGLATVLLYVVLWKVIGGTSPDAPTDLMHWLAAALSAVGVGSVTSAGVRTYQASKSP